MQNETRQFIEQLSKLARQRNDLMYAVRKALKVLDIARLSNSLSYARRVAGDVADNLCATLDAIQREDRGGLRDGKGVKWADKPEDDDIKF